jgi:hypothetical protein
MQFLQENGFNVFVTGRWNALIFTPAWIKANLFDNADIPVSMAWPLGDPTASMRLTCGGVSIFPSSQALDIQTADISKPGMIKAGEITAKILHLLPHTPIGALGVNFRFSEKNPLPALEALFGFADAAKIPTEKYTLAGTQISRSFTTDSDVVLNLSVSRLVNEMVFEFNFHTQSSDIEILSKRMSEANLLARFDESIEFMKTAYELDLEA